MSEAFAYAARRAARVGIVGTILILSVPVAMSVFNALFRLF